MPKVDNELFYTSAIKMHGVSAKGVNWHSKDTQRVRFKVILDLLPNDLSKFSIADAGCGFGDLYNYMQKNKKNPKKYIGIDSLYDMYSIATQRTSQEILIADICKEQIPFADYYICSGAMNVLNNFETHLFIRNCFFASKYGFVFNILHGDKSSETYNYMTTKGINIIAKDLNVENVVLVDNYLQNDITVGFFKNPEGMN